MFRRRLKFAIIAVSYQGVTIIQYTVLTMLLRNFQNEYQPIVAICLPVIKNINAWVLDNCLDKAANGDVSGSKTAASYAIATTHAVMMCYIMGSVATTATLWFLMGIDFMDNFYKCLKIIWMKKRASADLDKQIRCLQDIVINELVEFTSPLAFIACFLAGYYGPNATLLGNIKASFWHFQKVDDIEIFLKNSSMIFFVDLFSVAVGSSMLWLFCRINLFNAIAAMGKEYGLLLLLQTVQFVTPVSYKFVNF